MSAISTVRTLKLEDISDIEDITNIHLACIEALSEAIPHGSEDAMDREKLSTLASLAGDEAYKARMELEKRFHGLSEPPR